MGQASLRGKMELVATAVVVGLATAPAAMGQVDISTTVQEVYDTNVFLENGTKYPDIQVQDVQTGEVSTVALPKEYDGERNDDFITYVETRLLYNERLSELFDTSFDAGVGVFAFADYSDQDRLSLNTNAVAKTSNLLLPDPYYMSLASNFASGTTNSTVGAGAATSVGQFHNATFAAGVAEAKLLERTSLSASYRLIRSDFLGTWQFGSNDDEQVADDLGIKREVEGSDYFVNTGSAELRQKVTEKFTAGLLGAVSDYYYTDVPDTLQGTTDEERRKQADQIIGTTRATGDYQITPSLVAHGSAGVDISAYKEDRIPQVTYVQQPDGSFTEQIDQNSKDSTSFAYSGLLTYSPDTSTLLSVGVDQSTGVDYDGSRVEGLSVFANGSHELVTDLVASLGARYYEFTTDSLRSEDYSRYEITAGLNYLLTQSWVLALGYNFTSQQRDNNLVLSQPYEYDDQSDYDVHRVFLSVTAYFQGTHS